MLHAVVTASLLGATLLAPPTPAPRVAAPVTPITWKIDPAHSDLTFKIRHFVSRVTGTVREWSGTIIADPTALGGGTVEITLNMATLDTRNERRDTHLKSADFFDVANNPTATFKSTKVTQQGQSLEIVGDLTLRGITKPVTLKAEYLGSIGEAVAGKQRAGFHATTTLNRLLWDVKWNRAAEGGGVMLGDDVDLEFNIEAVRQ